MSDPSTDPTGITPSTLNILQSELVDLQQRLERTRWPDQETVDDPTRGPQLAKIRQLVDHWRTDYDWRRTEALLNDWGQYTTTIDDLEIHFINVRSTAAGARPSS